MSMWPVPPVGGPRDLPALRRWMIHEYQPDGTLGFGTDSQHIVHSLPGAPLWWVEGEACDLLAESAPTIPGDVTLTRADVPSPDGLVVFEHDIVGSDAYPEAAGRSVILSAILWAFGRLPDIDGEPRFGISFLMFSRMDLGNEAHPMHQLWRMLYPPEQLVGPVWAYIGRTDWIFGYELEQPIPDNPHGLDPYANASMNEDKRLMYAVWKLATTPVARLDEHPLPRHMRRQAERESTNPTVRVLTLHGPSIGAPTESGGSEVDRRYRVRWVVRPHWRWQAHGPGRSERKLIMIPPHIKGPEGAPLLGGERVWRVVAPTQHERN